jgi:hypothetical protein
MTSTSFDTLSSYSKLDTRPETGQISCGIVAIKAGVYGVMPEDHLP